MMTSRDVTTPGLDVSATSAETLWLEQHVQHLLVAVEHELRAEGPSGLSELALIKSLQNEPWKLIGRVHFHEPDQLYPVHFLLFHVLYRLRDQLATTGESLSITPLHISISQLQTVAGSGLPGEDDKLRRFYLDLSQYHMPKESIHRMLDDFWSGHCPAKPELALVTRAAETLGFSALPDHFAPVKQRFRKLVMNAHPDRGGNTEAVQKLNEAFSVLKTYYA